MGLISDFAIEDMDDPEDDLCFYTGYSFDMMFESQLVADPS
jgi:hypothetical protein